MIKIFNFATILSLIISFPVHAQEGDSAVEQPQLQLTEELKLQAQQNIRNDIDFMVKNTESQQMKRILKASQNIQKTQHRQKNRLLSAEQKVSYEEKKIDVTNKNALKEYFNNTYLGAQQEETPEAK